MRKTVKPNDPRLNPVNRGDDMKERIEELQETARELRDKANELRDKANELEQKALTLRHCEEENGPQIGQLCKFWNCDPERWIVAELGAVYKVAKCYPYMATWKKLCDNDMNDLDNSQEMEEYWFKNCTPYEAVEVHKHDGSKACPMKENIDIIALDDSHHFAWRSFGSFDWSDVKEYIILPDSWQRGKS